MFKKLIIAALISGIYFSTYAGEGMWLPILLKQLNEADMKANGLKLSAEDIYSVNNSSLKDAIVHFGGGCTSEIISSDGLLLTNHHCGYGRIQSHSSVENDYLTDGYWAMNSKEELPNPGLTATLIKRMEDVTDRVMEGVTKSMGEEERNNIIDENIENVKKQATENTHYEAIIRPFYYGNSYYMFVTEVFKDIRLVGAPPSSIGKFGFDTDNWIWPRHTGDFSLFRIYADKDNKPAKYSADNVPYKPAHFLPITLQGVNVGDFTMVYGFPGRTQEYLTSFAVKLIQDESDPLKVALRTKKLEIMNNAMASSDKIRIMYAAKQSSTSNSWKKWKGEIRGLKKLNAIEKKRELEKEFISKVMANSAEHAAYEGLIGRFEQQYKIMNELEIARDYFLETSYWGVEMPRYVARFVKEVEKAAKGEELDSSATSYLKKLTTSHFKNYDWDTDRKIFIALMEMYGNAPYNRYNPAVFKETVMGKYKGDYQVYANDIYSKSVFVVESKMNKLLENWNVKTVAKLAQDPAFQLTSQLYGNYEKNIKPEYQKVSSNIEELSRLYMEGLQKVLPGYKKYYPDANSTLRITYGKVDTYSPADAVIYEHYTTLDGVIEKYDPDVKEFDLPDRLIELHSKKDYGKYAQDGQLPVCFIASNHTTGGNSGSPVLNGNGELIGLNFDRNWEGTMSDIMYDPDQCRNIAVDIRYVLFIIDKFAGAGYLLENMDIK